MGHTIFWGAAIGALAAYDVMCARRGDESTLSCTVRRHLTTREREILFIGGWAALTAWFVPHILSPLHHPNVSLADVRAWTTS